VMSGFYRSMLATGEDAIFTDTWSREALTAGLAYLRSEDCRPLLKQIQCPAIVIHGSDDVICPLAAAEELASDLSNAWLVTLPGAGHAPMVTRQTELTAAIRRCVDEWLERDRETPVQ
jgi:pimeloyl-[acyl-carrier protein] methyl ester esterase